MIKTLIKMSFLAFVIMLSIVFFANKEANANTSLSVGLGIEPIVFSEDYQGIFDSPLLYQDDKGEQDNDGDSDEVEIDDIKSDDGYPVWDIIGKKYYETPFRRFEVIFFASFSYLLFLNVTIIETTSTIVPYFGGRLDFSSLNATVEGFGLPLIIYAFVSSFIFAVAVAAEDYRFVYIKNAHLRDNKNNDEKINGIDSDGEDNKVEIYFSPSIVARGNSLDFGLLLINF